jgi:hypothetical protein
VFRVQRTIKYKNDNDNDNVVYTGDWLQVPVSLTNLNGNEWVWNSRPENGTGTIEYENGDTYTGTLKDNLPHGSGTKKYREGEKYVGGWVDGNPEGYGVWEFSDGRYEGWWQNGNRHGQGTLTYKNGDTYEVYTGEFTKGRPSGVFQQTITKEGREKEVKELRWIVDKEKNSGGRFEPVEIDDSIDEYKEINIEQVRKELEKDSTMADENWGIVS